MHYNKSISETPPGSTQQERTDTMKAIFILADSTNRRFLNLYGSKSPALTPNIDRIAARGTVFENHWCGSAPCMPARRDIMTGRLNFLEKPWGGIEPFDQTLPALLKTRNVYTRMVTDHYLYFHVGGENYWNDFTSWEMIRGQEFDSLNMPAGPNGILYCSRPDGYKGIYSREHDETYGAFRSEEEYPSPMTMKNAAAWLEKNADADNFMLWVEGFDPHEPFDVPQKYIDLYREEAGDTYEGQPCYWPEYRKNIFTDEETRHLNVRYKALLTMTDHYIGKILDVLDRHDMWKDTMVIFTTDHGYMLGEHDYMAKNYMPAYNEVFHIPLVVWDPRVQNQPARVSGLTQNIDMFPTLLSYFGVDMGQLHYPIHGKDLSPMLSGQQASLRDGVIYGYFGKSVNYTDGKRTYFRAAATPENRPLNVYTAIPTTLRQYYGVGCIAPENYCKIRPGASLPYTNYPVYSFPADIIDFKNPSQEYSKRAEQNSETCLFDQETDYEQEHPLQDPALLAEYEGRLKACMEAHQAPAEQYERLGL